MKIAIAAAGLLLGAAQAQATNVFTETFDSEANGATSLTYYAFSKLEVVSGSVDLLANGAFGLPCAGGAGSCVDLDGSTGGTIRTRDAFAFSAGDVVRLDFDLAGSQRGDTNSFTAGFMFGGATNVTGFTRSGGFGSNPIGGGTGLTDLFQTSSVASGAPYSVYTLSFTALTAGTLRPYFSTNSTDTYGPLLDNVKLDITGGVSGTVPEPATWGMMLLGFGLVGSAARRRRGLRMVAA